MLEHAGRPAGGDRFMAQCAPGAIEVGRKAKGCIAPLPQRQFERASRCGKTRVFRDDLASQPAVSSRLRGALTSLNCEIRRLRPAAPRGSKGIDVREMLRHCRAGLTLAPSLSPYEILYCQVLVFSHRTHSLRLGAWPGRREPEEARGCLLPCPIRLRRPTARDCPARHAQPSRGTVLLLR